MKQWQEDIFKVYTEAKQFEAGKYHPKFGKTAQEFRSRGFSVPSRDAMIFISNLLETLGIFSEEEADSVIKNFKAAERRLRFLELLDIHSEEIKSAANEIDEEYAKQLDIYSKVESVNRGSKGRGEKYSANAAARDLALQQKQEIKDLKASAEGGAAAALNVLSAGLDEAEQEVVGSLQGSFEDPTTIFEIKLANPGFVDKVLNFLKPFIGDSEVEVYEDTIEFSADPGSDIAKLVTKIGPEKVENTINDWLDNNTTGGVAIIIPPDDPRDASNLADSLFNKSKPKISHIETESEVEPEYGSPIPDAPEMGGDIEDYSPRYSSKSSIADDVEDWEGSGDYTPHWANEDEEHFGSRRDPREGEEISASTHDLQQDPEYSNRRRTARWRSSTDYADPYKASELKKLLDTVLPYSAEENQIVDQMLKLPLRGPLPPIFGDEDEEEDWERAAREHSARFPGESEYEYYEDDEPEENYEEAYKMSPKQVDQWMHAQRLRRMQNNLRQNERWGNY